MTLRKKLEAALVRGVQEERGRVLWLINQLEENLKADIQKKLLIEAQRHTAMVKLKIFQTITSQLRRAIVSNVQPPTERQDGRRDQDGGAAVPAQCGP